MHEELLALKAVHLQPIITDRVNLVKPMLKLTSSLDVCHNESSLSGNKR